MPSTSPPPPIAFPPTLLNRVLSWLLYWKESTIVLPITIFAFLGLCWAVLTLTGRPLLNDVGSLVDFGMATLKVIIWTNAVAVIQYCLFGYRTESRLSGRELVKPKLEDDIYDGAVSFVLLVVTGYAYANWF